MWMLKEKATGKIVDPKSVACPLSPSDFGAESWEEVFASERETDLVDGWETVRCVEVQVDSEYSADEFWAKLDAEFPAIADELREKSDAVIAASDWVEIQKLPGFSCGPKHAPTALIEVS